MTNTGKLDLFKLHKQEYTAKPEPALTNVGVAKYLTITGQGEPGGDYFQRCVAAIYGVAFTVRTAFKEADRDYAVSHLEGMWWSDAGSIEEVLKDQPDITSWRWKLMIRVPDFVKTHDVRDAVHKLLRKGDHPGVELVKLERFKEGLCVQELHVGPYEAERQTLEQMIAFAHQQGLAPYGPHHEIYLSDPRRVPPERLKTILRHPVKAASM